MSEPREIQVFQIIGPSRPDLVTRDWRPNLETLDRGDSRHPAGSETAQDGRLSGPESVETALSGTSVPATALQEALEAGEGPCPEADIPEFAPESDITPSIV